ncbi:MAG: hypothetical protein IJO48_06850, partial [Clostridia bacterium]|nr:hypothetical protein [Clostridia bacterium]
RMQLSCFYPPIEGAWRQTKALSGGGCIMDLAVHCMELFSHIIGEDISDCKAYFSTNTFDYEVEDSAVISFTSENGILGHIDVNFNIPDDCSSSKLEIYGTKGSIYAEGTLGQEEVGKLRCICSSQHNYEAQQIRMISKPQNFYGRRSDIYAKQFKEFNKLLRSFKRDYSNAQRALSIQLLCDKIYETKQ